MPIYVAIIIAVVTLLAGFGVGILYRKSVAEARVGSAEDRAVKIVEDAKKEAENKKKEI